LRDRTADTLHGRTLTLPEWIERLGISKDVVHRRLCDGWPVEVALLTPVRKRARSRKG
jgi:hypothetical protein